MQHKENEETLYIRVFVISISEEAICTSQVCKKWLLTLDKVNYIIKFKQKKINSNKTLF